MAFRADLASSSYYGEDIRVRRERKQHEVGIGLLLPNQMTLSKHATIVAAHAESPTMLL